MKKKTRIRVNPFELICFMFLLIISCNKEVDKDNSNNPVNTVTDIDGNVYRTVTIGTQTWMVENLKVTRYRNGDSIINAKVDGHWEQVLAGAYCNYNNDPTLAETYGRLYNWYAVYDWRNIAPLGWHVPTRADWDTLANFLIKDEFTGGKLKETGNEHWLSPNKNATNSTGFTALPGGNRYYNGHFLSIGRSGNWWSSTRTGTSHAWHIILITNDGRFYNGHEDRRLGYSVRCIKD